MASKTKEMEKISPLTYPAQALPSLSQSARLRSTVIIDQLFPLIFRKNRLRHCKINHFGRLGQTETVRPPDGNIKKWGSQEADEANPISTAPQTLHCCVSLLGAENDHPWMKKAAFTVPKKLQERRWAGDCERLWQWFAELKSDGVQPPYLRTPRCIKI